MFNKMDSVPVEIVRLGLGVDDYVAMARNVRRILNVDKTAWEKILDRANEEFSDEARVTAMGLSVAMCYDREFFREAGFKYANGPPVSGCFITAIADYLLRNQNRIMV